MNGFRLGASVLGVAAVALFAQPTYAQLSNESSIKFLNGSWLGKYQCDQGITKLLLVMTTNGSNIDAVFNFSSDESSSS